MEFYQINWKLHSPLETELQSDTIFGHFCWALLYCYGEERLQKFLGELDSPRFLLSSAFPEGYLPYPNTLPVPVPQFAQAKQLFLQQADVAEERNETDIRWQKWLKKLKKVRWLKLPTFLELRNNFSLPALWLMAMEKIPGRDLLTQFDQQNILSASPSRSRTQIIVHNRINRLTGTTTAGEASLFGEEATFYENQATFTSYLQTDAVSNRELQDCFSFIAESGFGRNKSTGKGHFSITLEKTEFPGLADPDAWLVLSNYVPARNDPTRAFYRGFTKFGKLGGNWSATLNPFKKPVFMLAPGSVVLGKEPPRGTLLRNIHEDPRIVQNCYTLSFPFRLTGGDDE